MKRIAFQFLSWKNFLLTAFFVVLVLSVLVHASPTNKIGRDSGVFLYIGQLINDSKLPYRDAWDNKPPAIHYVNALGLWLGGGTRWGVWVLEFFALLSAIFISFLTMKKLWGEIPALGGTLLWLWGLDILFALDGGNMTEEYPLFLHFLSVYIFIQVLQKPEQHFWYVILGLNFGISFLFRPNNVAVEVTVFLALAFSHFRQRNFVRQIHSYVLIAVGALTPILFAGIYFARFDAFQTFLDATLLYNFSYGSITIGAQSPFQRVFVLLGGLAWFAALGYIITVFQFYKSIKDNGVIIDKYFLFVVGAPVCVFLSDLAYRGYEHYFINTLPMIGFLGGLFFSTLTQTKQIHLSAKKTLIILATLFIAAFVFFVFSGRMSQYFLVTDFSLKNFWGKNQRITPISKYARIHSEPDDTVLFWGAWAGENFMASRRSASAIVLYPNLIPSKVTDRLNFRFLEDIKSNKPAIIVDMLDPFIPALDPIKREKQSKKIFWDHLSKNLEEVFNYIHANYALKEVYAGKDIYYPIEKK